MKNDSEKNIEKKKVSSQLSKRKLKVGIIGGSGALGGWFGNWFAKHGYDVILHGRNLEKLKRKSAAYKIPYTKNIEECVQDRDIVMISVPIANTPELMKKAAESMKKDALLFDVASVKHGITEACIEICHEYDVSCCSIHPMFGEGAESLKDKKIILIEPPREDHNAFGKSNYSEEKISEFINNWKKGLSLLEDIFTEFKDIEPPIILRADAKKHDKMMATSLALVHSWNILFADILKDLNILPEELNQFSGTTFRLQKIIAESVLHESPEIYGQIQFYNKEFAKILELASDKLKEYKKVIDDRQQNRFSEIFNKSREFLEKDPDYQNAYKYFYKFLKDLKDLL
ncbi:MAG: prephenate dehydrogenase/arogenate dehydrogenase family protein [Promethearchaeota archaeon]